MSVDLLVLDLDNTVWDWLDAWNASFSAALTAAAQRFGVSSDGLKPLVKAVHQRHGTSEYPFWIYEIGQLRGAHTPDVFDNLARELRSSAGEPWRMLGLYPGVRETLTSLAAQGVRLVGFTDSFEYHTRYRLRRTGLDSLLDAVYSPAGHGIPTYLGDAEKTRLESERAPLAKAIYSTLKDGEVKPDPRVLLDIIIREGGDPATSACVGDNKLKDVLMAQRAGVADVHAMYGESQHSEAYALLKEVTHWTPSLVTSEATAMTPGAVTPSYVLKHGLSELLEMFEFAPFVARGPNVRGS